METKKFKVATYFKIIYIEKKITYVDAYDEEEALILCEKIHEKELDTDTFWDDVETIDSLPISKTSPMWIEENDEMAYPNYDPFDESKLRNGQTERKTISCTKHGPDVEPWIGCLHVINNTAPNIDFTRFEDDIGGQALCFQCTANISTWDQQKQLDSVKTICQGCLINIVRRMSAGMTKDEVDNMFFGLEDLYNKEKYFGNH